MEKTKERGIPLRWFIDRELAKRNQWLRDELNKRYPDKGGVFIHITSGYRSPEYADDLRERGYRVAEFSQHLWGKATDIQCYWFDDGEKILIPAVVIISMLKSKFQWGGIGPVDEYTTHHDTRNAVGWIDITY